MSFKTYLDTFHSQDDCFTHNGMGSYIGKYNIPDDELSDFWQKYNQEVFIHKKPVHLIERHTPIGPIIVDFDFRYTQNTTTRAYTHHFIDSIVRIYHEVIQKIFDLSVEEAPEAIQAFIFERSAPYVSKGVLKDGIHIMYPFLISEPAVQFYIREQVLKHPELESILQKIPMEHSITPSIVIDRTVIYQNGWFLYGSTKPGLASYQITRIIGLDGNDYPIHEYPKERLPELLSIRNKKDITPIQTKLNSIIQFHRDKIHKKINPTNSIAPPNILSIQQPILSTNRNINDEEIQTILELVNMLSEQRCNDYNDWIRLGWVLYNISSGTELFILWDDFSRKSPKYEEGKCALEWTKMKYKGGLGVGSLHYWAQEDNPEAYSQLRARDLRHWLMNSLSGTNVDVANVLYRMFRYQYICASIKYKLWYEFIGHRWREIDDGIMLRNKIPNELVYEYQKLRAHFFEKIQHETRTIQTIQFQVQVENTKNTMTPDMELVKNISERITQYREDCANIDLLLPKLKTTTFIENVMRECRGLFLVEKFQSQLDADPYLLGFENGIYELKTGVFRDGRPEDYISLSTGTKFQEWDPNSEASQGVKAFLSQIQPNSESRDYLLTFLASCLEGANADESFHIWTGRGGNGKSKINELFLNTIGQYASKLPISLLTQKRSASNAANPELMDTKGKRYCYLEEPGEGELLNVGLMKELTGGDRIKARGLYRDFTEFKPQFKLSLLCNELPKVPPFDEGTWRRLKVLEFRSRFVANPKEEMEYPRDLYLSEKLVLWKEAFMGLLIQYYQQYKSVGLQIPENVIKFTRNYQKGMDQYNDFIELRLQYTQLKEDRIELNEVYHEFKSWYEENIQTFKVPTKTEFKHYFEKKYTSQSTSPTFLFFFKWKN